MSDVDIFVGNDTVIDEEVYELWLCGYSAHEAACIQQHKGILQRYAATFEMLFSDILDYYRLFSMLEKYLKNPTKLGEQLTFQMAPASQKMLIEKYYEFDAVVIREILGKKLTSRNRKDLDDVSEKTKINLKSCRRQFDNIKHVFKTVEDLMGSLVENIQTHFLISNTLAQKYAAIVFITNCRFETLKKKLHFLTFDDFAFCANQMIENWSYSSKDCVYHEDMDIDIDMTFLHELRDIKILVEKEFIDEHKKFTLARLQSSITNRAYLDADHNFKTISKALVGIGSGLNHSKEFRDLFVDIVEKIIEPCRHAGWTYADLSVFLKVYKEVACQVDDFQRSYPHVLKSWDRYMQTVIPCILQMYHI